MNSPSREQEQGMSPCPHPELDIQSGACTTCGLVIEDRIFSTEDMEDRTYLPNAINLNFGKPGIARPPFLNLNAKKESSVLHIQLDQFCGSLLLPPTCKTQMYSLLEFISKDKVIYGRSELVSASIAYIIMRRQNYVVTLLDIADKFRVNVFEMGSALQKIIRENNLPNIRELSLRQYMERAFQGLQHHKFHPEISGEKMDFILSHANILSDLADRYCLSQGRRHGPMAAAALALAFEYNGFKVNLTDIIKSLGEGRKTVLIRIGELNQALLYELVARYGVRVESVKRKKCGFIDFPTDFAEFINHLDLKFKIQQIMPDFDKNLWAPDGPPSFMHSKEKREKTQEEIDLAKMHIIANFSEKYPTVFSQKVGFFSLNKEQSQSPIPINSSPSCSSPPSEVVTPISPPLSPILSSTPEQISSPPSSQPSQPSIPRPLLLTPISTTTTITTFDPKNAPPSTRFSQTKTKKMKRKQQQQQQQQPSRNLLIEQMLLKGVRENDILNGNYCSYPPKRTTHPSNCPKNSNPSLGDEILCECDFPESELSTYLVPESEIRVRTESLGEFEPCRRVYKRHCPPRKNTTSLLFPAVIPFNINDLDNDSRNRESENDSNLESDSQPSSSKGTGRSSSKRPLFSAYLNQNQNQNQNQTKANTTISNSSISNNHKRKERSENIVINGGLARSDFGNVMLPLELTESESFDDLNDY